MQNSGLTKTTQQPPLTVKRTKHAKKAASKMGLKAKVNISNFQSNILTAHLLVGWVRFTSESLYIWGAACSKNARTGW